MEDRHFKEIAHQFNILLRSGPCENFRLPRTSLLSWDGITENFSLPQGCLTTCKICKYRKNQQKLTHCETASES